MTQENTPIQSVPNHGHTGLDSRRLDPKFFLPLPVFATVPDVSVAPNQFIHINGATLRLYVKAEGALYYTALTAA